MWQAGYGDRMARSQHRAVTSSGCSSSPTGSLCPPHPPRDPTPPPPRQMILKTFTLRRTLFTKRSHGWKFKVQTKRRLLWSKLGRERRLSQSSVHRLSLCQGHLLGTSQTPRALHNPAGQALPRRWTCAPAPPSSSSACSSGPGKPGASPETTGH